MDKGSEQLIRILDLVLALLGLLCAFPVMVLLLLAGIFDTGSPILRQTRVGRYRQPFTLYKFRTMRSDTATVPTHLVPASAITPSGRFMRRTKLDELPQLWNVLKGEMSLVGPRPCLPEQTELIEERAMRGVYEVLPGITGLAQIQGIDMSDPRRLAEVDAQMLERWGVRGYFRLLLLTVLGKGLGDRVGSHHED